MRTFQFTVWDDRYELFIEHRSLVAGTPVAFGTHVTDLETLEPRREGPAIFVLRHAADPPIEQVDRAPARPGIYTTALTFPRSGEWHVSIRLPSEASERTVELPRLQVYASNEAAAKAPSPPSPEGIAFLKEQQWKLKTRSQPVGRRRLVERLRVPGVVNARPDSRASVNPPIAGRLVAPPGKPLPTVGDRVEAGQPLALVQPPFSEFEVKLVESEAAVVRTKLAFDRAERVLARTQKLAAEKARSERELEEAEFALRDARADHDAALAEQEAYRKVATIFVRGRGPDGKGTGPLAVELGAPISGVVTQVNAAVGEYVAPDRAVFSILDLAKVFLEARIPEADLGRLAASHEASYETPDAPGRFVSVLREGVGREIFLGLEVHPVSRTVPLLFEVANPDGRLRVGMALSLYLETAKVEEALAVPDSAIVEEEGRWVAFVQASGETFEKRDLRLGIRDSGFVQVLAGLSERERVVTSGAYAIRLASVSTAIPAQGHAH